jgi:hypothetical protein
LAHSIAAAVQIASCGVVRGQRLARVGVHGVFGEGGGLELHRAFGTSEVRACVDAGGIGLAVA